jgi:hypothetical protein
MKCPAYLHHSSHRSENAIIIPNIGGLPATALLAAESVKRKTARKGKTNDGTADQRRHLVEQMLISENGSAEKAASQFFAIPSVGSGEFLGLLKRSILGGP